MSIAGVSLPIVELTIPLPKVRKDGTELALGDIQSITILRDAATLTTLPGPFSGDTVNFTDPSPATGTDLYSYFATDTAGLAGERSAPVAITVTGLPPKSPPAAGTLKAVAKAAPSDPAAVANRPHEEALSPYSASNPFPATNPNPASSPYEEDNEVEAQPARSRLEPGQTRPTGNRPTGQSRPT